MQQGLSEDAQRLLVKVVVLGLEHPDRHPDGWVRDEVLWEQAGIDSNMYDEVAAELWKEGLVERQGSDYAVLRTTPEGKAWFQEI